MTIRIINPPRSSASYWYVMSHVKEVTQFTIIFDDGGRIEKRLSAKVELLSVMDSPRDGTDAEYDQFFFDIGCSEYSEIREREVVKTDGYYKMTSDQFSALDLPKFL